MNYPENHALKPKQVQQYDLPNRHLLATSAALFSFAAICFFIGVRMVYDKLPLYLMYHTFPYLVAGTAITGAIYFSILHGYFFMATLMAMGIITACGLAA